MGLKDLKVSSLYRTAEEAMGVDMFTQGMQHEERFIYRILQDTSI